MPDLTPAAPPIKWVGASATNHFAGRGGQQVQILMSHVMLGTLAGTEEEFNTPGTQVSAHFGVGLDGTIVQYVALSDAAFANGPVRRPNTGVMPPLDAAIAAHINPNYISVAVEWEGTHTGVKWILVPWNGEMVATMARVPAPQFWVPPAAQWTAGVALYRWLASHLTIPIDRAHLGRHSDVDSVTKWFCPGAGFPLGRMIGELGGQV